MKDDGDVVGFSSVLKHKEMTVSGRCSVVPQFFTAYCNCVSCYFHRYTILCRSVCHPHTERWRLWWAAVALRFKCADTKLNHRSLNQTKSLAVYFGGNTKPSVLGQCGRSKAESS
ncbi:hypothetical protein EVAR_65262_1 [Eumeta japonica]|uniref:Uncharacterized protein n=1 Tax=Eumeta variegata TaxID=151549 RepID=A0A4C1ZE46_EUMVA|nr:hypothetical protein EVAR_65262_1 [Eumeta japonica]